MKSLQCVLFTIVLCNYMSYGQTTDHVKLYVLYDISHSTSINKSQNILYELTSQLMEIQKSAKHDSKDSVKIAASIDYIPFGQAKLSSKIDTNRIFMDRKRDNYGKAESAQIAQSLDSLTFEKQIPDLKTHLLEALLEINDDGDDSFGVVIITDGQLEVGDIEHENVDEGKLTELELFDRRDKEIQAYRDKIGLVLRKLKALGHPYFIIQSSEEPRNKYYKADSIIMKRYMSGENRLIVRSDFFWLKNNSDPNDKSTKEEFRSFVNNALYAVTSNDNIELLLDNPIKRLILYSQIENLRYDSINLNSSLQDEFKEEIEAITSNDKTNSSKISSYELFKEFVKKDENTIQMQGDDGFKVLYYDTRPIKAGNRGTKELERIEDSIQSGKESIRLLKKERRRIKKSQNNNQAVNSIYQLDENPVLYASIGNSTSYYVNETQDNLQFIDLVDSVLSLLNNKANVVTAKNLKFIQDNLATLLEAENIKALYKKYKDFVKKTEYEQGELGDNSALFLVDAYQVEPTLDAIDDKVNDRDWQETIVLGLSDYLVERAEREALFIFYEEVYEKLLKPNSFISDTLFYNFSNLLKPFGADDNQVFEANLNLLKEALNKDVDHLPVNITKHPKLRESDGLVALYYVHGLVQELQKGHSLEASFDNVANKLSKDRAGTVAIERSLLIISRLLAYSSDTNLASIYLNFDEDQLEPLSRLLLSYISLEFPETIEVQNLNEATARIKSLLQRYGRVKKNIESLKTEVSDLNPNADFEGYSRYKRSIVLAILKEVASLLEEGAYFVSLFPEKGATEDIRQVISISNTINNAIDVLFSIEEKRYAEAVAMVIPMLPSLPVDRFHTLSAVRMTENENIRTELLLNVLHDHKKKLTHVLRTDLIDITSNNYYFSSLGKADSFLIENDLKFLRSVILEKTSSGVYTVGMPSSFTSGLLEKHYDFLEKRYKNKHKKIEQLASNPPVKNKLVRTIPSARNRLGELSIQYFSTESVDKRLGKLLAMAGEASTATTAGDVKNVFQKYALPVASYRMKRQESNHIMINAYLGGGFSYFQNSSGDYQSVSPTWVLSAPVGLEYSLAFKKSRFVSSFSIFVPLLDVGNVINYSDRNSDDDREVQIEQVISPGGYLVFGISRRFPVSVGIGYQGNPDRLGAFIALDLPLFKLK